MINTALIEHALVFAVLMNPNQYADVLALGVNDQDFTEPRSRAAWQEMDYAFTHFGECDMAVLLSRLQNHKDLFEDVRDAAVWLSGQSSGAYSNATTYAKQIRENTLSRKLHIMGTRLTQSMGGTDAIELYENVQEEISRIGLFVKKPPFDMRAVAMDCYVEDKDTIANDKPRGIMDTGFPTLDQIVQTLRRGQFVVIGAKEKRGKSRFMLQLAARAAHHYGLHVLHFSLEMDEKFCVRAIVGMEAALPAFEVQQLQFRSEENERRYFEQLATQADWKYLLEINGDLRMIDIFHRVKQSVAEKRCDVVIVDYIQLLATSAREETRQQQVARDAQALKNLAMEFNVLVVAGSQLNHEGVTRESTGIQQAADKIIKFHREDDEQGNQSSTTILEVIQREGVSIGRGLNRSITFNHTCARYEDPMWAQINSSQERDNGNPF